MEKPQVTIHTDGSCLGNPGAGGWAATFHSVVNGKVFTGNLKGAERFTTNNRMELTAAIRALQALKGPSIVTLFTDSQYVIKGITEWAPGWVRKNWLGSDGKPVKNKELWLELLAAAQAHTIEWRWVRGHAGHAGNELVDSLAHGEAKRMAANG